MSTTQTNPVESETQGIDVEELEAMILGAIAATTVLGVEDALPVLLIDLALGEDDDEVPNMGILVLDFSPDAETGSANCTFPNCDCLDRL